MRFDSQFYDDYKNYSLMMNKEYESAIVKKYENTTKKDCFHKNTGYNQDELSKCIEIRFNSLNLDDKIEDVVMNVNVIDKLNKDLPIEYKSFWLNECPKDKIDWELFQWEDEERMLKDFETIHFKKFNEKITRTGLTRLSEICKSAIERSLYVKSEYRKSNNSDFYEDLKIVDKAIKSFKNAIHYQPKISKPLRSFKNFDKKIFLHISKAISNIPNLSKEQAVNTAVEIMWGISSGTLKDKISNDEMKAIDIGVHLVKQGRWNRPSGMPANG